MNRVGIDTVPVAARTVFEEGVAISANRLHQEACRPLLTHDDVSGCRLPARTEQVTRCNCAACRETRRLEAEKWDEPRISAPPQPCALWVGGQWRFFPIGRHE